MGRRWRKTREAWVAALLLAGFTSGCPAADPPPPPDSTAAQIDLGRHLFYDFDLSIDSKRSCGICHEPAKGFTDGFVRSVGHAGDVLSRNALTLTNVGRREALLWTGVEGLSLAEQLLIPLLGDSPPEMGFGGREHELLDRLSKKPLYPAKFAASFPQDPQPITLDNLAQAIARFEATLISKDTAYDRYLSGEPGALSEAAERGRSLFFSAPANCFRCHSGPDFDQPADEDGELIARHGRSNIGLYNVDGEGAYPEAEQGLIQDTGRAEDMGVFRTPTLRNVALTGPYTHDGSVATLDHMIRIFAAGGRLTADGPNAGDGRTTPYKDVLMQPYDLSPTERADLVEFLHALTDHTLINDPAITDPFVREP
jgi:cytochrome c peroxidase